MVAIWRRVIESAGSVTTVDELAVATEEEAFEFVDELEPEDREELERELCEHEDREAAAWVHSPR